MKHIHIRLAVENDISEIERIQQRALDVLSNKDELDPVETEQLFEDIKQRLMAVAVIDNTIAAFRTMHLPEEDYLGPYAGIHNAEEAGLIYSDITIVDPDYRGLSLQRKLGDWLFNAVANRYKIIMATVHPDNTPSLKDKFHLGMQIVALDKMYGGKLRYIFFKAVNREYIPDDRKTVNRHDYARVQVLLEAGYRGIDLLDDDISFGKFDTTTNV